MSRSPVLRESSYDWAKSAYAIEINPWVTRDDAEAVLLFRGTIVAGYAQIETRLAEIAFRASRLTIYAEMQARFPRPMKDRLSFLRAACQVGPLAPCQSVAMPFLQRFEGAADLRHLMAHARMEQVSDPRGWGITFIDYDGNKGGAMMRRVRITLGDLERQAWKASRLSRVCQRLLHNLDERKILPPLDVGSPPPGQPA